VASRHQARLVLEAARAAKETDELKRELETVRYRTVRLGEQLAAADSEARQSRQLMLLGRFTAGFLHEFNNPLAILTSRIEVLLEERKHDPALCADLNQMLKEARYMANISGTLLPALRRERGAQTFSPCGPADVLHEIVASLGSSAAKRGVQLVAEPAEVPPVNLPEHVLAECLRALVANALDALHDKRDAKVWMRLETYHNPGSRVVLRVEDNGPGVPDELREHLFEPFTSSGEGRERLGLGLFVAASLLDTYDGSLKYEPRTGGGARFTLELPPSRYTKEEPYHWFVQEAAV
jgi:two-component system C4-dicarboxylate transport sensor histidine kinase DctB